MDFPKCSELGNNLERERGRASAMLCEKNVGIRGFKGSQSPPHPRLAYFDVWVFRYMKEQWIVFSGCFRFRTATRSSSGSQLGPACER